MSNSTIESVTPKEFITQRLRQVLKELTPINTQEEQLISSILRFLQNENDEWTNELLEKIRVLISRDSCVFCGGKDNLAPARLIPRSKGGPMLPINLVMVCSACDEERGDKGLYEWWVLDKKQEFTPRLEIQYLTVLYLMHKSARTLNMTFNELHQYCTRCEYFQKYRACEGNHSMLLCLEGMIDVILHE